MLTMSMHWLERSSQDIKVIRGKFRAVKREVAGAELLRTRHGLRRRVKPICCLPRNRIYGAIGTYLSSFRGCGGALEWKFRPKPENREKIGP